MEKDKRQNRRSVMTAVGYYSNSISEFRTLATSHQRRVIDVLIWWLSSLGCTIVESRPRRPHYSKSGFAPLTFELTMHDAIATNW